jgi:hypothetical protein
MIVAEISKIEILTAPHGIPGQCTFLAREKVPLAPSALNDDRYNAG